MLLFSKYICFSLTALLIPVLSFGQTCDLSIKGRVFDESTGIVLPFASIYDRNTKKGVVADSLGYFAMKNLCPGIYQFQYSHIGCETKELTINLINDTSFLIFLDHHTELMNEVVVHGKIDGNTARASNTINTDEIVAGGNKNLAEIIEKIQGVSTLKTGSGISKPVIQGLYGNRVTILNNDIAQSGQQWGNDHSPEIDPFVANHISVIKGASALSYSGNSLGGIVLVEPGNIPDDPTLNGNINYIFQSNGIGHTLNTQIGRQGKWAAWRVTGTLKTSGDMKSSDYYLTNTGKREGDLAVQLEKKISGKWHTTLYYSLFNSGIGVLKGSQIGNLEDLNEAIGRPVPFFTKDNFSYKIEAPRQDVQHHLLKLWSKHFISDNQLVYLKYGGQLNSREEFDVSRSDTSEIQALSLFQNSQFIEGAYELSLLNRAIFKTGLQFNYVDNTNTPEIDVLPLIPDYRSYHLSGFAIFKKDQKKLFYEAGARYDLKRLNVASVSNRIIERFNHLFQNYSLSGGAKYQVSKSFKTNLDIGYVLRAPEINELYSFGLHQGVSGIEEGDKDLVPEKSLKFVLLADLNIQDKLFIQVSGYYQDIQDYIYLQPQKEFRLTIRGAFPVFIYRQTNVIISGTDMLLSYEPVKNLKIVGKFATVKGRDKSRDIPLIYMPATNLTGSATWLFNDFKPFKGNSVALTGKYVFKQQDLLAEQDFLEPPDAYLLLGLNATSFVQVKGKKSIKISLQAENVLNKKYRDYMDRQRYFADDLGINVVLRFSYNF